MRDSNPSVEEALARLVEQLRSALPVGARSAPELADALAAVERALSQVAHEQSETHRTLRRVLEYQRRLDDRLVSIEHGLLFRTWRSLMCRLHRQRGARSGGPDPDTLYRLWLAAEAANAPAAAWYSERMSSFCHRPAFAILIPVSEARPEWLERTVASLLAQTYEDWQLCVLARSEDIEALRPIRDRAARDGRLRLEIAHEQALHADRELAGIEYVAQMEPGDMLAPSALHELADVLQDSPADLVYSDEDGLDAGGCRHDPIFKPGWSPDLLTRCMYLGRLLAFSRAALDRIGWFREEFGPMQEYDAALRLAEAGACVRHVARVLYHRAAPEPEGAHEAGRRALGAAVARRRWQAAITDGPLPATYRLLRQAPGNPLASIIVCSKNPRLLRRCLRAVELRTAYPQREIVVVEHQAPRNARMDTLLDGKPYIRVPYQGPFNFSHMNNLGARNASGEVLVFLNDDAEPLDSAWLDRLVAEACRPEIGAVGARLLYPSGSIQHAGIALAIMGGAGHPGRNQVRPAFWKWVDLTRNVSAVTGACMAVHRRVFKELGGFDPVFPCNYNDVDFCLRARQAHYEVTCEADAVLRHYEASTRVAVVSHAERERFYRRWGSALEDGDPFYNPNLTRDREDASLQWEDDDRRPTRV